MTRQARSRRGNGQGSIYLRRDGRWTAAATLLGGKRKQVYGRTGQDVTTKLMQLQNQVAQGLPISPDRLTIGQCANQWLESRISSLKASTVQRYEQLVRNQIVPTLGRTRLNALQVDDLERCYASLLSKGLSAQTVTHVHRVMHTILNTAVRWGLIGRNIASASRPPRVIPRDMPVLDARQVRMLLDSVSGTRLEAAWMVLSTTGLRSGELCALRWHEVDLDAGLIDCWTSAK